MLFIKTCASAIQIKPVIHSTLERNRVQTLRGKSRTCNNWPYTIMAVPESVPSSMPLSSLNSRGSLPPSTMPWFTVAFPSTRSSKHNPPRMQITRTTQSQAHAQSQLMISRSDRTHVLAHLLYPHHLALTYQERSAVPSKTCCRSCRSGARTGDPPRTPTKIRAKHRNGTMSPSLPLGKGALSHREYSQQHRSTVGQFGGAGDWSRLRLIFEHHSTFSARLNGDYSYSSMYYVLHRVLVAR